MLTVPKKSEAGRNRLLYYPDRVAPLANSALSLLLNRNKEPNRGLLSALWNESSRPTRPPTEMEDESIDSFFRRRLGDTVADKIASALCHGIYGGDSRTLSMGANFPQIMDLEQRYGSVVGGSLKGSWDRLLGREEGSPLAMQEKKLLDELRSRFDKRFRQAIDKANAWSLQGGLETLIEGMVNDLGERDVDIRLGARVKALLPHAEGVQVRLPSLPCTTICI